jgi:CHAT domain-containing protein
MDQADALSKSGHMTEALEAIDRIPKAADDSDLRVRIAVLRGAVLGRLGKLAQAEDALQWAAAEAARRGDKYQQTAALLNLAMCRKWAFRYSDALEYGLQAAGIADSNGFRRLAAIQFMNLGSFYGILGDYDNALHYEQQAIGTLQAIGDRGNLLIAIGELGLLYRDLEQYDKAVAQYGIAFNLASEMNRSSDAARIGVNSAQAFIILRNWNKAQEWNDKARGLASPKDLPYVDLNDAQIAAGRGDSGKAAGIYRKLVQTPELSPNLAWDSHSLLAHVYVDQRKLADAGREFRTALETIDKARADLLKSQHQITFLSSMIGFHQDYVDLLVTQNDNTNALRIIESSRARVLTERLVGKDAAIPNSIDIPQLKKLAKDTNTSLLSFWIAPKRSFAWLIDKSGVHRFDLPPEDQIESLVTAYRETVEHALRDPIAAADPNAPKLWNALLAQIAPKIPKNSRVVIIPDGPLHRLNFETLPVPSPTPHYWIEDVEIAIAPSLAIANSKPESPREGNPSLLLIGAPDYTGTDFRFLAKTGAEIHGIQARFPKLEQAVYTGRQASPDAYRASQPARFSLIHFAAHAEASHESPLESAVVLSRHGDSNKLYARDVIDQPIHADLVTISGCRSAGVRAYAGEGLIGFAWAFLQAGARSVVAGLWDVSDSSTEPLMNRFYAGIAAGEPPSTAMRNAKLALLKGGAGYSKPYYWAPFQVYLRTIRK